MWCGPRNISTALMRAWGNRPDTFVVDEPLYAHYLRETRLPHAMADEIIEHYEADWEKVAAWLTGPVPGENSIFYQKQMCPHMLPGIGGVLDLIDSLCFALPIAFLYVYLLVL